jgi:DNA-binding CsgD family transcriptional regulator/tetratricopeptide (TPR) repeat protein
MHTTSSGLFGRDRELDEADRALATAASGEPQALLVGGDAGIGKTTLVAAIGDRARAQGFTVLTGHCLDLDAGVPLQPVREALRTALDDRAPEDLPPVTQRMTGFLRGGAPDGEGSTIEDLGLVVDELSDERPLLIVLEDMHWADRSTQDFAIALSRTMRRGVCLLLTFRTDELTRRHPFRRSLVEIGRGVGARRLDLAPLGRDGISGIVESCTGGRDAALVGSLLARSEGNPLYAEELLQAGADSLPGPLNDLLLARVDALSAPTRDLLRLASVNGSRLDPALLGQVAGLEDDPVEACLREAIDANVVTATGEYLDFRHGLLREAVYDDLLPGERTRAHGRLAATLQQRGGDPGLAELGLLAYHWYAAHDLPAAYAASARAGLAAYAYGGPEAIGHLDRALGLYDQVPHEEAEEPAKADLIRLLAETCKEQGDHDRAQALMLEALCLVDDRTDRLLASRVYSSYVTLCSELEGQLSHQEAVERAVSYAEGPPSEELATALTKMAHCHDRFERVEAGRACIDRAVEVAAAVPVPTVESIALQQRGWLLHRLGFVDAAMTDFADAHEAAVRGGSVAEAGWAELHRASVMVDGLDPARGLAMAGELRTRARGLGVPEVAAAAALTVVHGLISAGALHEADLLLSELLEEGTSADHHDWRFARMRLLTALGDAAAALPLQRATSELFHTVAVLPNYWEIEQHIEVLVANGLADEALETAREYAGVLRDADAPLVQAGTAGFVYLALLAARAAALPADDDLAATAADLLDRAEPSITEQSLGCVTGTFYLIALARRADLAGDASVNHWRSAYEACARIGAGYALPVRRDLAAALLSAGERDEARILLPELWAEAQAMGARGVAAEAARLAHRYRIALPEEDQQVSRLDVLTTREREVLDVLVTGASNRVIAERLFISEKTVSVHVTNLMAKLGVSRRGEAAALARELAGEDSPV